MTARELTAAGITEPGLRRDYTLCRALNARHGRTYFLATRLLPPARRPAVHALYGFARWADDIVDDLAADAAVHERAAALSRWEQELAVGLRTGSSGEPVVRAVAHTARTYGICHTHFTDFMASMRMDLQVRAYPDYPALQTYMHGSAAVIGLQMMPVLGTVVPAEEAEAHAAALGVAFQLTNFLRDVGEDLDRDRVYLPGDLLAAHGVDRGLLQWSRATGRHDPRISSALRAADALTREVYREAEPGIALLDPVSRPCIRAAYTLYSEILDAAADAGYPVLHRRVAVSPARRAVVAARGVTGVAAARLRRAPSAARRRPGKPEPVRHPVLPREDSA
ncbi:phytoene/squalene synthase family protein [Streptomyces sp. RKND-216]|uniref:phytoene/squalene synthase family protein n=1 Tax=Streptomyces sp. RKND-216 TaxID=2562581 RepID=UPI00109E217E|nr:phytoene/squalene synthase family protein [Streptomyces sp. RKND-216]THA24071.1 phytoene/squalene synthase family protein [Streptomyces sp. RKND-216]